MERAGERRFFWIIYYFLRLFWTFCKAPQAITYEPERHKKGFLNIIETQKAYFDSLITTKNRQKHRPIMPKGLANSPLTKKHTYAKTSKLDKATKYFYDLEAWWRKKTNLPPQLHLTNKRYLQQIKSTKTFALDWIKQTYLTNKPKRTANLWALQSHF